MSTKNESKAEEGAADPKAKAGEGAVTADPKAAGEKPKTSATEKESKKKESSAEEADESKEEEEKGGKINVVTGDDDFKYQIFMGQRGELLSEVLMFYDDSDMQDSMNKTMKTLKHIFDPSLEGAKPFEENPSKSKKNNTLIRSRDDVIDLYNKYNEKLLELEEKKKNLDAEVVAAKAEGEAAASSGNEAVAAAARDVAGETQKEKKDCSEQIAETKKDLDKAKKQIKDNEEFNEKLIKLINDLGRTVNITEPGDTDTDDGLKNLDGQITAITKKIADLKLKKEAAVAGEAKSVKDLVKKQTEMIQQMQTKMAEMSSIQRAPEIKLDLGKGVITAINDTLQKSLNANFGDTGTLKKLITEILKKAQEENKQKLKSIEGKVDAQNKAQKESAENTQKAIKSLQDTLSSQIGKLDTAFKEGETKRTSGDQGKRDEITKKLQKLIDEQKAIIKRNTEVEQLVIAEARARENIEKMVEDSQLATQAQAKTAEEQAKAAKEQAKAAQALANTGKEQLVEAKNKLDKTQETLDKTQETLAKAEKQKTETLQELLRTFNKQGDEFAKVMDKDQVLISSINKMLKSSADKDKASAEQISQLTELIQKFNKEGLTKDSFKTEMENLVQQIQKSTLESKQKKAAEEEEDMKSMLQKQSEQIKKLLEEVNSLKGDVVKVDAKTKELRDKAKAAAKDQSIKKELEKYKELLADKLRLRAEEQEIQRAANVLTRRVMKNQKEELEANKEELEANKEELAAKNALLVKKKEALAEKDAEIAEKQKKLAEKKIDMDALVKKRMEKIQKMIDVRNEYSLKVKPEFKDYSAKYSEKVKSIDTDIIRSLETKLISAGRQIDNNEFILRFILGRFLYEAELDRGNKNSPFSLLISNTESRETTGPLGDKVPDDDILLTIERLLIEYGSLQWQNDEIRKKLREAEVKEGEERKLLEASNEVSKQMDLEIVKVKKELDELKKRYEGEDGKGGLIKKVEVLLTMLYGFMGEGRERENVTLDNINIVDLEGKITKFKEWYETSKKEMEEIKTSEFVRSMGGPPLTPTASPSSSSSSSAAAASDSPSISDSTAEEIDKLLSETTPTKQEIETFEKNLFNIDFKRPPARDTINIGPKDINILKSIINNLDIQTDKERINIIMDTYLSNKSTWRKAKKNKLKIYLESKSPRDDSKFKKDLIEAIMGEWTAEAAERREKEEAESMMPVGFDEDGTNFDESDISPFLTSEIINKRQYDNMKKLILSEEEKKNLLAPLENIKKWQNVTDPSDKERAQKNIDEQQQIFQSKLKDKVERERLGTVSR